MGSRVGSCVGILVGAAVGFPVGSFDGVILGVCVVAPPPGAIVVHPPSGVGELETVGVRVNPSRQSPLPTIACALTQNLQLLLQTPITPPCIE